MKNEPNEDSNVLGKKRERESEPYFFTKEESYEYFEHQNKFISTDIELIKSYSKNLFSRLKQSPIEIINIVVSPYTKFNSLFLDTYNAFLEKIKEIKLERKKIIKYIYNNGDIHDEPITFPSDSNVIKKEPEEDKNIDNNNIENNNNLNDNNNPSEEINPYFVPLNSWEIAKSIKEYKWEGIIKILILFGDNGFIKQIIKNIDCYHNNYIIINLNKITKQQKSHFNSIINNIYSFDDLISYLKQDIYECSIGKNNNKEISNKYKEYLDLLKRHINYDLNMNKSPDLKEPNYLYMYFNNIINNIYSFEDLISYLKQDIYECSNGKNNIKEISDKYEQYLDLLKRYTNYDLNANNKLDNKEPNYFFINFGNKNNIIINKKEWALFDANSSSKSYICQCFSSKIKKDWENGISNLLNPEHIINQINVELAISNNIYNILNINANDDNINFHINDLTLGKKMIGSIKNKMDKNYYNQDFFLNNILLNYAICDYICDKFNMKLSKNGINLNVPEICFYQCSNYVVPYFIAKEYHESYKKQYNLELYESFSHFSYCVSLGKILIEDIQEFDGKIFSFNILKDDEDKDNEGKLKIFRFFCYHKCNKYCEALKLNNIDKNFYEINTDALNKSLICDICKVIFNINNCNYDYEKDDLCLCYKCYKKVYESKYQRVCVKCGNIFEYYYLYYILQKKETPSLCETCKKIVPTEDNLNIN